MQTEGISIWICH